MKEIGTVYGLNGLEIKHCTGINIAVSVVPSMKSLTMSGIKLFGIAIDTSVCDRCLERESCKIDEKEILKKAQSFLIKKDIYP